ncbi:MAG TPA: hypothetical protein VGJ22_05615 [Anaerolineales bacterium]
MILLFAFIGALPWLAELPAKPRYPDQSVGALEAKLVAVSGPLISRGIVPFLSQPNAVIAQGRLLYPRYFYRGAGLSSANAWPAYAVRDFPRTGFMLLNASFRNAFFPGQDAQPFPHGADAIVLGCQRDGYIEVRLIGFPAANIAYLSDLRLEPCSSP